MPVKEIVGTGIVVGFLLFAVPISDGQQEEPNVCYEVVARGEECDWDWGWHEAQRLIAGGHSQDPLQHPSKQSEEYKRMNDDDPANDPNACDGAIGECDWQQGWRSKAREFGFITEAVLLKEHYDACYDESSSEEWLALCIAKTAEGVDGNVKHRELGNAMPYNYDGERELAESVVGRPLTFDEYLSWIGHHSRPSYTDNPITQQEAEDWWAQYNG